MLRIKKQECRTDGDQQDRSGRPAHSAFEMQRLIITFPTSTRRFDFVVQLQGLALLRSSLRANAGQTKETQNMTPKEFDKVRLSIQKERYQGEFDNPFSFAIARAEFEQRRFLRLIAEAQKVVNPTRIVQSKIAQWKRQYDRAVKLQERLQETRSSTEKRAQEVLELPAIAA